MSDSNVISLGDLRKKQNRKGRKSSLPLEQRIEELEEDQSRLIELAIDMEKRLYRQERYISKLVRMLADHGGSTSKTDVPTRGGVTGEVSAASVADPDPEGQ